MVDLSVIILTYNEHKHIARCIESIRPFTDKIFLVDSFSEDDTVRIAESMGAIVEQNPWESYAPQFQWGQCNNPHDTTWIMRMDADEFVTKELAEEINRRLPQLPEDVSGVYVARRVFFMGRWIKHGGYYPTWLLRIFRDADGFCESRRMDEHIKLRRGRTIRFENDIVDHNLNNLGWWTDKHNDYATREAITLLRERYRSFDGRDLIEAQPFGSQEERKRWLKKRYASLPLFVRPFVYFLYRYLLRMGLLDGKPGLVWHFLQGCWYRFLADAKLYEIYRRGGDTEEEIAEYLYQEYGCELRPSAPERSD